MSQMVEENGGLRSPTLMMQDVPFVRLEEREGRSAGCSWWRTRRLERSLLAAILVVTLICLGVSLGTLKKTSDLQGEKNQEKAPRRHAGDLCTNMTCYLQAAEMVATMNFTADPCEDFYEFACGRWAENNPLGEGEEEISTDTRLNRQINVVVQYMLERPYNEQKSRAEREAKTYYTSCMKDCATHSNLTPLKEMILDAGGWEGTGDPQDTLQVLKVKYGVNDLLFGLEVGPNLFNSTYNSIWLSAPEEYVLLNNTVMENVAPLLGYKVNDPKQIQIMMKLDEGLSNITKFYNSNEDNSDDVETSEDVNNDTETVRQLDEKKLIPFINWQKFLTAAFKEAGVHISGHEKPMRFNGEFLSSISHIFVAMNTSSDLRRMVNNLLIWRAVFSLAPFLTGEEAEPTDEPCHLRSDCTRSAMSDLKFATSAMFVHGMYRKQINMEIRAMSTQIRRAMIDDIRGLDWLDEESLGLVEQKIEAISEIVGYSEFLIHPGQLDIWYRDLETMQEGDFIGNKIRINRFNLKKNLAKLAHRVDKSIWENSIANVYAQYDAQLNRLDINAAYLLPPFYDNRLPQYLNFGNVGYILGHEMYHALDDSGIKYDLHGNLRQWLDDEVLEKFENLTECIKEQSSRHRPGSGPRTFGEDIADNGGLRAAYFAYLNLESEQGEEPPLPLLNLSPHQLFFVNYAQQFCSHKSEERREDLDLDTHSQDEERANVPLSNLPEFAKTFKCPSNSKMNPREQCRVW